MAAMAGAPPIDRGLADEAGRLGLTIGTPRTWTLDASLDGGGLRDALWVDGYFATPPSIPPALVACCRDAIALVRAAGAPPLAAFVFDAPWELAALLGAHADAAFAGEARLMPAFWAWRIEEDDARGWEPHRDRPGRAIADDGRPEAMAMWVALTDATSENGCMYVVPARWDPFYRNPRANAEVMHLQAIRALPARAGAVLGWTSRLLHWGAMARPSSPPRVSLSFEYQDAAVAPIDGEAFVHGWIPPVDRRRALIAEQWHRYRHIHRGGPEQRAALDAVIDQVIDQVLGRAPGPAPDPAQAG